MWYGVVALVNWIEDIKETLDFHPTGVTLEDLMKVHKIAWRGYGVSMYSTLKDWKEILERLAEEGYLKRMCLEKDGETDCRYKVTEKGKEVAKEVNEVVREKERYSYVGFFLGEYLKAASKYFQMLCEEEYRRGSDVGERCKKVLNEIEKYVKEEYPNLYYNVFGDPLAVFLVLPQEERSSEFKLFRADF